MIMKKIFYYIIAGSMLLLALPSCKDVLNQQAVDTFNQDVVFSDIQVVKAYLGKCYDRMGGNTDAGILGMREDLLSDATDQTLCIHRPANYGNIKNTLSPDNLGYFSNTGYGGFVYWNNLYSNIQNLNTIIDKIDAVPTSTAPDIALKTRLKGEAYFIRALMYSNLMMNYGGVVLIDKPNTLKQDFQTMKRSTLAQTKDFILADIASAIATLPATSTIEQGRATPAAAAALKSRILLFCASSLTNGGNTIADPGNLISFPAGSQTALLQAARDAAKDVMNGTYGTYSLVGSTAEPVPPLTDAQVKAYADNYQNLFLQKGKWNSETIWGIQYPLTGGNVNNANLWYGPCAYHNWGNNDPTEPAVRSFEMADGTPFVWDKYTPGDQYLRTATAAQLTADPQRNPYVGREPRFYAIVLYNGAAWQTRPTDVNDPLNTVQTGSYWQPGATAAYAAGIDSRQGTVEAWNGTKTGYYLKKFLDPSIAGQYFRNTTTWVEFRYAEILLNYAEACIELGGADLVNGLNALNLVRNRAGLPDRSLASTQAQARTYIRQERAIEFFGEGHRYYDLRRWVMYGTVTQNVYGMKIKQFANGDFEWKLDLTDNEDPRTWGGDKYYWIPLSRDEMNKAPNLQPQPGY
jgi:starch-binding outer membrane protein, SusD/RagB family